MTLEELAELSSDKLKALTDDQLKEILTPYFVVTRPELAPKPQQYKQKEMLIPLTPQKRAALALMAEEGIDIGFIRNKKKK
jgi:hypothetical protein